MKISQNSQENTCARSLFFNKVAGHAFFTEYFRMTTSDGIQLMF